MVDYLYRPGEMTDVATDDLISRILKLPHAAVEATEVVVIPQLLSEEEIQQIFDVTAEISGGEMPTAGHTNVTTYPHHTRFGGSHAAFYLHRGGRWLNVLPSLSAKLTAAMRSHHCMYISPQVALNLRCVEFHTYTPGDGLTVRGHRDEGSLLTMSILLSRHDSVVGGTFTTCSRDGATHVPHPISRGDAILFHSEKMHNVMPVTKGVRHSLVIELWQGKQNTVDRFR